MTTYSWKTGTSGDWNTPADWTGGVVPVNSGTSDVVIDAGPVTTAYTVTISSGESVTVGSLALNSTNNATGVNSPTYAGAVFEVDGSLTFAPGSAGLIDGPLQSYMIVNGGTIVNAGTINAFVQTDGNVTFSGTNGIYFTNWLQSLGETTINTTTIAEYQDVAPNMLSDGIFEANGTAAVINLGGSLIAPGDGGLVVNIATVSGPGAMLPGTDIPGWTELIFDGPASQINEWNGTAYVPVASSITLIENNATILVDNDLDTKLPGIYTTTKALTIGSNGLFDQVAGTLSTGGLTILSNGTLSGAPTVVGDVVNDGTILVSGGAMVLQGSVSAGSGTGVITFGSVTAAGTATVAGTLDVQGVSAGELVALTGGDTLVIRNPASFKGTVSDAGDNTIVLAGMIANSATLSGGMLNVYNGTTLVDSIAMSGTPTGISARTVGSDGVITLGGSPPPVIAAGATSSYTAGAPAVVLDGGLTVSDPNSATLVGATVSIGTGFFGGDTLNLGSAAAGITSSYNPANGVLTLTGTASLATYQAALDSVTYASTAADPTNGGPDTSRTINWSINDGSLTASATSSLAVGRSSTVGSSLLWQHSSGQMAVWQMNGPTIAGGGLIGPSPGTFWTAMGTGSFFTGDTSDIAFQGQDGSVALWEVQGTTLAGGGLVAANPGTSWHIKGTGDFYGDGHSGLLWQNDSGDVAVWEMTGTTISQSGVIGTPGASWHVEGTGNFYGDGNTDVLFQNDSGEVAIWDVKGTSIVNGNTVANPSPSWRIEGTGDFYGDGHTDILFQNDNGMVAVWEMNGTTIVQGGTITNPGPAWHVVGTGDFNGDGKSDIALQNDDGSVAVWEMNGTTIANGGIVANPTTAWSPVGSDTMRFIYSGAADETLTASPTAPNEFVFDDAATGAHTITGFSTMQDIIELNGAQFASFADVQAAASPTGDGGTMINLGNGASLQLPGVDPTTLLARDFALT
jgi:hypothetical protein